MLHPRVFIGSSREGHHIAELLQLGLDSHAECTIWSQGVFGLSGGTLESLCDSAKNFDFAALILTPDDLVQKRSDLKRVPRDNVLFELGLFMGILGRESTFIVHCSDDRLELPSDLAGVSTIQWRERTDGNMRAALGPACTTIRLAMDAQRLSPARGAVNEADDLRSLIEAQSRDIRALVESIKRDDQRPPAHSGDRTPDGLAFLEGIWRNPALGSFYYPRLLGGVMRCPYCYAGNESLTGEFHDIVRTGDILTGKFRWFSDKFLRGCFYLRINTPDELVGGWWYDYDLDVSELRQHSIGAANSMAIKGMVPHRLVRDRRGAVPQWALDYYEAVRKAIPGTT